jgi:hypothetical protein
MEWRTVMSSSPIRTSRTTSRTIFWRCSTVKLSAFAVSLARKASSVSVSLR